MPSHVVIDMKIFFIFNRKSRRSEALVVIGLNVVIEVSL